MMNTIIEIGYLGMKRCYLNLTEEEAVKRYCESEDTPKEDVYADELIDTITFEDEFVAYSIWEDVN